MMMSPRRRPERGRTEPASTNPDRTADISGIEGRGVRSARRVRRYADRDRQKSSEAPIEGRAESDDPSVIIDAVRNVQRRKTGLPHVNGRLGEIEHATVYINEGSLLGVAVAFADYLSPIVDRSSIAGLGKSAEGAEILHRSSIENEGARAPIASLAVAHDNPMTIDPKRLAIPAAQRPKIRQMVGRKEKPVRRAAVGVISSDDHALGVNPIRGLKCVRALCRDA
jgi:hypothetical protein